MSSMLNYYNLLRITEDADTLVILAAYRELVAEQLQNTSQGSNPIDGSMLIETKEAYEILSDPMKRAAYDTLRHNWFNPRDIGPKGMTLGDEDEAIRRWQISNKLYPEINEVFEELRALSFPLANTFRLFLAETKRFSEYEKVAYRLRVAYFKRRFGNSKFLQKAGRTVLESGDVETLQKIEEFVWALNGVISTEDEKRIDMLLKLSNKAKSLERLEKWEAFKADLRSDNYHKR